MFRNKPVLGIITARGGSKRIPRKNLIDFKGKPLIYWTIAVAQENQYIDRLIVSTDDNEIAAFSRSYGAETPFKRPKALATDDALSVDVIIHALTELDFDGYFVLLQPTSPLRTSSDIDTGFDLMEQTALFAAVSTKLSNDQRNGAVYISETEQYILQREFRPAVVFATHSDVDIDTYEDLKEAKRKSKNKYYRQFEHAMDFGCDPEGEK